MNRDRMITVFSILIIAFILYWSRFQQGRTYTEIVIVFTPVIVIPLIISLIKRIRKK
ncbi:hypothetical protein ABID52_000689 [Fictibacillus halophilus]|uniref:Uncharacterized protein n=1 Tax=Fictibacillus halophilus TaxID=1610490 RepID=A0ABV2LET5_9BACL|nr:hypothetical protein [Fictibacillus halophilus]